MTPPRRHSDSAGLILVDIGNTGTTLGLARAGRLAQVAHHPTADQNPAMIRAALKLLTAGQPAAGSILCSVVPKAARLWRAALARAAAKPPLQVGHDMRLNIELQVPRPDRIGPDRLANAVAVAERGGLPAIIADFGTALTVDVVTRRRAYLGGIIAPGLPILAAAPAAHTALLPRLDPAAIPTLAALRPAIGRNTIEGLQLGVVLSQAGAFREILAYLRGILKPETPRVYVTGGLGRRVLADCRMRLKAEPDLNEPAMYRIYTLNAAYLGPQNLL